MENKNKNKKAKFGIETCKWKHEDWSFSIGLASEKHEDYRELYLYIIFYKWSFLIGWK